MQQDFLGYICLSLDCFWKYTKSEIHDIFFRIEVGLSAGGDFDFLKHTKQNLEHHGFYSKEMQNTWRNGVLDMEGVGCIQSAGIYIIHL